MSAYRLGNAPNLYNADGSPAGQMGLDGEEYPSSVSGALNRSTVARVRPFGTAQHASGTFCAGMSYQAPGEYDGVRIILHGAANSASNTVKVGVAAPASVVGSVFKDSAGNDLAPTAVTWGAASLDDVRVVGGQATTLIQNVVGSGNTLQEGDVVSDYISLRSVPRTDVPGAPPLFGLRLFGVNPPMLGIAESDPASNNSWAQVIPEWRAGYWGTDQTAAASPPAYAAVAWSPGVTVLFYRRACAGLSIHVAGDSLDQGWVAGTAVPQFGGNINGWPRRLVALLNAAGLPATLSNGALTGSKSFPFHERAYNALLSGHITHLFAKPWSTNENGDGVASVPPALERMTRILDLGKRKNVPVTIIRPWAGQSINTTAGVLVQAYCDAAAAAGVRVFDARAVIADPADPFSINPNYLTRNSGGAVVDPTHLNDAGQAAVAAAAFAARMTWLT